HGHFLGCVPSHAYHHDQSGWHKLWHDNGKSACPKADYSADDTPHPGQNTVRTGSHLHPARLNACLITAYLGLRLVPFEYVPALQYSRDPETISHCTRHLASQTHPAFDR